MGGMADREPSSIAVRTAARIRHGDRPGLTPWLRNHRRQPGPAPLSCCLVSTPFVPDDFEVPLELATDRFRLEPLGPEHNERDHEAWMSSIAHIRATPGFPDGKWPTEMSAEQNLADLVRHAGDFAARTGFTYSVLDGDDVIGCVYLYPANDGEHDVEVQSWVRASRAELDMVLRETVSSWLAEAWPFQRPLYEQRR
jgi:RimJ/RimL family protein N-acetyltransferase